jgi:hypothetical protein
MGPGRAARPSPFARLSGRLLIMSAFYNIMLGYFFGFALGVGCALAVFYAIYSGGYRKAVEDSLLEQKPKRYLEAVVVANRRAEKGKAP